MRPAAVFNSNMVLQHKSQVRIFGTGEDGEKITVSIEDVCRDCVCENGKWIATLPEFEKGGPHELIIKGKSDTYKFENIVFGEVWLAGGQSNMEFELANSLDGEKYLESIETSNVRYYNVPRGAVLKEDIEKAESSAVWQLPGKETSKSWSAVAYHFADMISKKLDITVGIIGCNLGGTSASVWVDENTLLSDKDISVYLNEYKEAVSGKSIEQQIKEYDDYLEYEKGWNKRLEKCQKEKPGLAWDDVLKEIGECRWPGPKGIKNPYCPCALYHAMLERVMPFTLKGFIYYQGEEDQSRADIYYKLFSRLIEKWRNDFLNPKLPFICVSLPMFAYENAFDDKSWPKIRDAQLKASCNIPNVYTAVVLDCGELNNIHPINKKPVGDRMALLALYNVYNCKDVSAYGPLFKEARRENGKVILSFLHAGDGFELKGEPCGFELSDDGENFFRAEAEIAGSNIILSCSRTPESKYVRYEWFNYNDVNIFGKNKIPLAPFYEKITS